MLVEVNRAETLLRSCASKRQLFSLKAFSALEWPWLQLPTQTGELQPDWVRSAFASFALTIHPTKRKLHSRAFKLVARIRRHDSVATRFFHLTVKWLSGLVCWHHPQTEFLNPERKTKATGVRWWSDRWWSGFPCHYFVEFRLRVSVKNLEKMVIVTDAISKKLNSNLKSWEKIYIHQSIFGTLYNC